MIITNTLKKIKITRFEVCYLYLNRDGSNNVSFRRKIHSRESPKGELTVKKQVASVETLSSTKLQTKVERKVELIENENRFQFYVLKIPIKFSNAFVKNIEKKLSAQRKPSISEHWAYLKSLQVICECKPSFSKSSAEKLKF